MKIRRIDIIFIIIDLIGLLLIIVLFLSYSKIIDPTALVLIVGVIASYLAISGWLWHSLKIFCEPSIEETLKEYDLFMGAFQYMEKPIVGFEETIKCRIRDLTESNATYYAIIGSETTTGRITKIDNHARDTISRRVKLKFISNVKDLQSLEKVVTWLDIGIECYHHPTRLYTMAIIDKKIVRLEFPHVKHDRVNYYIHNEEFAKIQAVNFESFQRKSTPVKEMIPALIEELENKDIRIPDKLLEKIRVLKEEGKLS